jgi:hypothetical protein
VRIDVSERLRSFHGERAAVKCGARARCGARRSLLRVALLLVSVAGCATASAEFRPYSQSSPHPPSLTRAVTTERSDVASLAHAGAIIIGSITAKGNGFAGPDSVEQVAALEAARRGGTHIVAEAPGPSKAGPAYHPGATLTLTFVVLRLPDAAFAQLPARLQPRRGVHYVRRLAPTSTEAEHLPLTPLPDKPLAKANAPGPPVSEIDGSHIQPLP